MTDTNTTSGAADDSLLLCASDLQHSAIYDNHVEMQSCMRAVAARIAALVHAAPKAEPAAPAAVAGPSEAVAYLDIGAGGYLDLGTDLTDEALSHLPKGRHALVIAGTYGIDGYIAAPATKPAPQHQARPVTPYTCPKCSALWLHWPAEQSGFGRDTLNCRSTTHCDYCEKGGVEQLQRLERVPAVLAAPQQEAQEPVEIPAKCPYFGPSPHRDVWLEGWHAACATKPAPQPVERKPLPDSWIRSMCAQPWIFNNVKQWVRITEDAHGIKGDEHDEQ